MPSSGEGFGIDYLEAMASGVPALGLPLGGAPDALGDGALGTLAASVAARFGREAFAARVRAALEFSSQKGEQATDELGLVEKGRH